MDLRDCANGLHVRIVGKRAFPGEHGVIANVANGHVRLTLDPESAARVGRPSVTVRATEVERFHPIGPGLDAAEAAVIGARVRVRIQAPWEYAHGCAASLDGATGAIERFSPRDRFEPAQVLVHFDAPAPPWNAHQLPAVAFWFPLRDVQPEQPRPECHCLVRHALRDHERVAASLALDKARVAGDTAGVTIAMAQLSTGSCPARKR